MFESGSVSEQLILIRLSFCIHVTLQTCADLGPRLFRGSLPQFYSCRHGIHALEHAGPRSSRTDPVPVSPSSGAAPP